MENSGKPKVLIVDDTVNLAARISLKRCANYMVNGVPPDWTGVETLSEK